MNGFAVKVLSILLAVTMLSACSLSDSYSESIKDSSVISNTEISDNSSGGASYNVSEPDLETISENLCKDMVHGDFALTYTMFSETMRKAGTEEQIAEAWKHTVAPLGGYLRYDGCTISYINGFTVADSRLEFDNGTLSVQITYSDSGIIEGLYFLYPEQ